MRGVALENLGNYTECLKSYLKAYEMDARCPKELLLSIVQVVGCVCQLSESEELTLSETGEKTFLCGIHCLCTMNKTKNIYWKLFCCQTTVFNRLAVEWKKSLSFKTKKIHIVGMTLD